MQHAIESVDPQLPFSSFHTISQLRGEALHQERYEAVLFAAFARLALLLAALGVYGLVSESVAQRTREMSIRMALGASVRKLIVTAAKPALRSRWRALPPASFSLYSLCACSAA